MKPILGQVTLVDDTGPMVVTITTITATIRVVKGGGLVMMRATWLWLVWTLG